MPATELTDERRRDLELIQMRDAIDLKTHYRKPERDVLPKYFQVRHFFQIHFVLVYISLSIICWLIVFNLLQTIVLRNQTPALYLRKNYLIGWTNN